MGLNHLALLGDGWTACHATRRALAAGEIDAVVVACPTAPLTKQWGRAAHALGVDLAPDADSPRPPRGSVGLYHLAWEVATIEDLATAAKALSEAGALGGALSSGHDINLGRPIWR